jgi:Spermidine synthase
MYLSTPENLIVVPLILWFLGGMLWFTALANRRGALLLLAVAVASVACHFALPPLLDIPKLAVSDYKGVAYARKFPDSQRVYERASPFGYLEVYSSSYLHFAPGLSDNAAFSLPKMPENAYLGMYIDGEGPSGIIRDLPAEQTVYYRFLPMVYPYLIKQAPDTFVVQFGGGISTSIALRMNSKSVTVAEGNPAVLDAFRTDKGLRDFTGDVLNNPKVHVIDYDGRLYLAHTSERYDVIDLSLADSAGLSSPGRIRHRREVLLYARSDEQLHARAQGWRRAFGDAVEQRGAAEVGAEALHHHGRGGARRRRWRYRESFLRGVELSLDRDRALQARRL